MNLQSQRSNRCIPRSAINPTITDSSENSHLTRPLRVPAKLRSPARLRSKSSRLFFENFYVVASSTLEALAIFSSLQTLSRKSLNDSFGVRLLVSSVGLKLSVEKIQGEGVKCKLRQKENKSLSQQRAFWIN